MRRITRALDDLGLELVPPPGGYGDGPAYLRIHRPSAVDWRRRALGLRVCDLAPFCSDPEHDYVPARNTHSAFAYRHWLTAAGVEVAALTVLRTPAAT